MSGFSFSHLSGPQVLDGYSKAKTVNRASDALLLAYLAEIDARNLFRDAGYPSMYAFVAIEFDFTDDLVKKRIRAARTARECPQVLSMLADGRLSLSSFLLLTSHLHRGNANELLSAAAGLTRTELERLLVARFPTTEMMSWTMGAEPESITTPEQNCQIVGAPGPLVVSQSPVAPAPEASSYQPPSPPIAPPPSTPRTQVTPIAANTSGVQFMFEDNAQADYDYLRSVLGHEAPTPGKLFALALKILRREVDKKKFSATNRPQKPRDKTSNDPRHIPRHIRRIVYRRDQHRCTFQTPDGKRCTATSNLELDHIIPIAHGGTSSDDNLRVLCRAHNQHAADQTFGADFMNEKRGDARARAS